MDMMQFLYNLVNEIWVMIVQSIESLDLILQGWADLPGELYVFVRALGPAGDVLLTVVGLCVGYLVLRLLITIVELIPGF